MSIAANGIRLERPSIAFAAAYLDAQHEGFADTSNPLTGLRAPVDQGSIEAHLASLNRPAPAPPGTGTSGAEPVPFAHLWMVAGMAFIGRVSIRYALNERLRRFGGHIGYEVRLSLRGHGFGHRALALGIAHLQARAMGRFLLTCSDDNAASARIIKRAGGVLENVTPHPEVPGIKMRRYWIRLGRQEAQ